MPFSISIPYFQAQILDKLKDANGPECVLFTEIIIPCLTNVFDYRVWKTLKIMACAGIIDALLDFWCVYLFSYTKSRIMKYLRLNLFQTLLSQVCRSTQVTGKFFNSFISGDRIL